MNAYKLLIWLTQLGLSTALPLAGFLLLGLWLHRSIGWGRWTIWVGLLLGMLGAFRGFRDSIRAMERMCADSQRGDSPTAYNRHDG